MTSSKGSKPWSPKSNAQGKILKSNAERILKKLEMKMVMKSQLHEATLFFLQCVPSKMSYLGAACCYCASGNNSSLLQNDFIMFPNGCWVSRVSFRVVFCRILKTADLSAKHLMPFCTDKSTSPSAAEDSPFKLSGGVMLIQVFRRNCDVYLLHSSLP